MKRLVFAIVLVMGMVSCQSTYFFSSLDTTGGYMEKAENGDFTMDGDSLSIIYSFRGQNAPVQITVFNKMSKPLYVDWAQSALVLHGVAYAYSGNLPPSEDVSAYLDEAGQGNLSVPVIDADSEGFVTKISPNRHVNFSSMSLHTTFEGVKRKAFKTRLMGDKSGNSVKVKNASFSTDNTPLIFSSYLTTYTNKDNPLVYQQDFYISNLIKTKQISPSNLPGSMEDRGDVFYVEKPANTAFVEGLLGVAIGLGAVVLELALDASLD